MNTRSLTLWCALAIAEMLSPAHAGIIVEYRANPTGSGSFTTPPGGSVSISGNDVTITHSNDSAWRVRTDNPATESIGTITFTTGIDTPTVTLIIGSASDNTVNPNEPLEDPGSLDWNGLNPGNAIVTLQARLANDLIGAVTANHVVRIDADGAIDADIIHTSSSAPLSAVFAGGVESGVAIESGGGTINRIETTSHMRGSVINLTGAIGSIVSLEGVIGSKPLPSPAILAGTTIDQILAMGMDGETELGGVYANIQAGTGIREIRSSTEIGGSILTPTLLPRDTSNGGIIRCNKSYYAETMLTTGLASTSQIIVGTDLSSKTFTLGDGTSPDIGMAGQIVIGGSVEEGLWAEPITIKIGGATRVIGGDGNENYVELPSLLGGGRAGVVPFNLHGSHCNPTNGALIDRQGAPGPNTQSIILSHYGEVDWIASLSDQPMVVYTKDMAQSDSTLRDVTDCFSFHLHGSQVFVQPNVQLQSGYQYVIVPATSGDSVPFCIIEGDQGPALASYEYRLSVGTCPADINGDGIINGADFSILLFAFGNTGCIVAGDLNNSGTVDGGDLSVFLFLFGTECEASESLMGPNGSASEALLDILNFESFEDYVEWIEGLSPEQLESHIADLLSIIAELEQSDH